MIFTMLLAASVVTAPVSLRASAEEQAVLVANRPEVFSPQTGQPGCPPGFDCTQERKKEGFLSTTNLFYTGAEIATGISDVESGLACQSASTPNTRCLESGLLLHGNDRLGMYAIKGVWVAATTVPAYFMRRSDNKYVRALGHVIPIGAIAVQGGATAWNIHITLSLK